MTYQTATERLRALLDERGVEWDATTGALGTVWTHWDAFNGHRVHAMDNGDGTVEIFGEWDVTPEQAVEATLGRGTCRIEYHFGEWYCTACGEMVGTADIDSELYVDGNFVEMWNHCPNCGAKVVGPTTNDVGGEVGE